MSCARGIGTAQLLFGCFILVACSAESTTPSSSSGCVSERLDVDSGSMLPTLSSGDSVSVCIGQFKIGVGDIVAFRRSPNELRADSPGFSRVVALAGDHVVIVQKQLVVNGSIVDYGWSEPMVAPGFSCLYEANGCTIQAGMVFLIGDNLQGSRDSRLLGPFSVEDILGRVCQSETCQEFA